MGSREERSAARDYVMARLAACNSWLDAAKAHVDGALGLFVSPDDDKKGADRSSALEEADECIGLAARAVQSAQSLWDEVDPKEGEPEPEEDEEEEEEEEEEDDE